MSAFRFLLFLLIFIFTSFAYSQTSRKKPQKPQKNPYPQAYVNFQDFKTLVGEVEKHRAKRLVSLDDFLKMSKEKNTIILDARSAIRFQRKHMQGAKNLAFTDFTEDNLRELIPDTNTRILIYCNNNFDGDRIDFPSKIASPSPALQSQAPTNQILANRRPIMLA